MASLPSCRYFHEEDIYSAPPAWLTLFEGASLTLEMSALAASYCLPGKRLNYDGHPVLVFPGLMASDATTAHLRNFIDACGHDCYGWGLGINTGPTRRRNIEGLLEQRLADVYQQSGQAKISLIGWSLGGIYARLFAHRHPDWIRQVITLASPVNGNPHMTNTWRLYEWVSGRKVEDNENVERLELAQQPLPVPCTSVYSKTDSIVAWQISRARPGYQQQNIQTFASHLGMAFSPLVFHIIKDRLAQPANRWRPFNTAGLRTMLYSSEAA